MTPGEREKLLQDFLAQHGHGDSHRSHLTGDASTRSYELIQPVGKPSIILMNAPPQPDGPPIRNGRPYSAIAHLAEDMRRLLLFRALGGLSLRSCSGPISLGS